MRERGFRERRNRYALLGQYGALLGSLRDEVHVEAGGVRASLKRLRDVRQRLLRDAADARTLAEELVRLDEDGLTRSWRLDLDFEPLSPDYWREAHLHELLLREIRRRADVVRAAERQVRADLTLDAEVVGAMANLRAQRSVWVLTAIVGAATIGLAAYQVFHGLRPPRGRLSRSPLCFAAPCARAK